MKTIIKSFIVILISLITLSACNNSLVTEEKKVETSTVSGSRYGKRLDCDMLKDVDQQEICKSQVNDLVGMMMENEITQSFDLDRCSDLLQDESFRCEEQIKASGVSGPVSIEEMKKLQKIVEGNLSEITPETDPINITPNYDIKACSSLKTSGYKEYCEKIVKQKQARVELQNIQHEGTIDDCIKLDDSLQSECKMFFGVFDEPQLP